MLGPQYPYPMTPTLIIKSPAMNLWIFGYENKNTAHCHSPLCGPPFLTLPGQGNLPDCGKNDQEDSKAFHKWFGNHSCTYLVPHALRNRTGKNVAWGLDWNDARPVNLQCDRPAKQGHRYYDSVVSLVSNQDSLDPLQSMVRDLDSLSAFQVRPRLGRHSRGNQALDGVYLRKWNRDRYSALSNGAHYSWGH